MQKRTHERACTHASTKTTSNQECMESERSNARSAARHRTRSRTRTEHTKRANRDPHARASARLLLPRSTDASKKTLLQAAQGARDPIYVLKQSYTNTKDQY
eukprot:6196426-Pleurochrysis_carterae.AAC.1